MCTINDSIAKICWNKQCDICPMRHNSNSCLFIRGIVLQTKIFSNVEKIKIK